MKYTAIKGIQAGKEYFTIMVKLKELEILFPKLEEDVLPEKRAQRKLNQKRIPAIKRYIVENLDKYVFSALAGSVDGKIDFTSFSDEYPEVGILEISDKATILINDGQHRKTAIIDALKECPALADETIPVVLFKDMGLKRSQQMFTDLNKHAVKTSNSLSELYDSTDKIAAVTRNLLEQNEFIAIIEQIQKTAQKILRFVLHPRTKRIQNFKSVVLWRTHLCRISNLLIYSCK